VNKNKQEIVRQDDKIIVIDSAVEASLQQQYLQHNNGAPSAAEMERLTEEYINREMLYREAIAAGLDKDNDSLKTLLAGQMSVAYAADEAIDPPTDEDIKQMLADKSWYANDSGLPDTSQVFIQMMKPKLRSRHRQQKTAAQLREKMKTLTAKYRVIKKDN
jgi:hypothetical protein